MGLATGTRCVRSWEGTDLCPAGCRNGCERTSVMTDEDKHNGQSTAIKYQQLIKV